MNPRAVIAEDEPLLAENLRSLLGECWPELNIAALAPNGLEALAAIEREQPEVAFLDIRMPGLSGLEVAAEALDRLGDGAPAFVFVTAHDEFALKAFDLAAADYVLKPVAKDRLARAVARLRQRLEQPDRGRIAEQLRALLGAATPPGETLRQIRASVGDAVRLIALDEVCYFQASDKYTTVMLREGEALIRTPLKELSERLPREQFQMVHRSTIVNLAEVAAAVRDESGKLSLRMRHRKETLPVSRVYAELFKAM
ncbi:MAG: response regulator transcription factor [Betaproteobacteria bacterium]|nr:response regulator transcription factor [Betaproteobacteria bacterium]